jgi:hypothetical protein
MTDDFESKVRQQIEQLKTCSCRTIEREVAEKRIMWFKQNRHNTDRRSRPSPRRAYELLFFDYMDPIAAKIMKIENGNLR